MFLLNDFSLPTASLAFFLLPPSYTDIILLKNLSLPLAGSFEKISICLTTIATRMLTKNVWMKLLTG
jgi:hypothetical protein